MTTIREAFAAGVRRVGFEPLEPPPGTPPLPPGAKFWRSSYAVTLLWPAAAPGVEELKRADDAGLQALMRVHAWLESEPPNCWLDAYLILLGPWAEGLELARHQVERRTDVARRFTVADFEDLRRLTFFPLPEPSATPSAPTLIDCSQRAGLAPSLPPRLDTTPPPKE